ncbi:Ima1 N-terminal domain-containing protein [Microdochium trichocladiopsis]|uniref:Ima1 N-terminal domain-containing protein n=1 Tax=Microdochium trichocladiopsis TaxID=1682393 RepID=A0A9P9BNV0_9PEZI|nr:Ima1 N-terminal domain-containing protein [Microdochium trichocladiopsis]KAH7021238.1 Ima1 N-terminal domain-containing protein [Microdochium trichocladiopsis]
MPSLRARRRLVCFYCGRRSSLYFEGQPKFNCTSCEATNWLDKDGEITDPPTVDRTPVQYAIPRKSRASTSPPSASPSSPLASHDSLFCATCLRNQHMLRSSLAQFEWPEDSTGAEYLAREKKYHLLRTDLERRYPQVCADCEPRVEKRLHEASYTAQTDHLKRMITKTRSQRAEVKNWSVLDLLDVGGKWAWHGSYVLQFAWHAVMLCGLLADGVAAAETESAWAMSGARMLRQVTRSSLGSQRVLSLAIQIGLCSFPWNPRFKQSIRGFTAHIIGFKQWYTYQLLAVLVRMVSLSASQYAQTHGITPSAQLGAQVFLTIFTLYVYRMAPGSIRTDTTPLFRRPQKQQGPTPKRPARAVAAHQEPNSLGDVLDDILHEPSRPSLPDDDDDPSDLVFNPQRLPSRSPNGTPFGQTQRSNLGGNLMDMSGLSANIQEAPPAVHYDEEMDWSPSTSQHRAFSTYNSYNVKNPNPRFNDIPVEPKPGPIWYKVPPAPTNPAQRLRNPPSRPTIRETLKPQKETSIFTRDHNKKPVQLGSPFVEKASSLNIAEPKFYAPEARNDPRDGLSNMFASSFSISRGEELDSQGSATTRTPGAHQSALGRKRLTARLPELVVVFGAAYAWNTAAQSTETYGSTVGLASLCAALMVSLRLTADLLVDHQIRHGPQASLLRPSWATVGLVQVIGCLALLTLVWSGNNSGLASASDVVLYGNVLFGAVVAHHLVHIVM